MKPKINLNEPIVKLAIHIHQNEVRKAWEMEHSVEKAVIPIFSVPKTKAHQKNKIKPEQIGSGVLVKIQNQYFIFSATHVFDSFENKVVITSTPGLRLIEQIAGERFSSENLETKIDKFDASVFHIQSEISESLKKLAITLDDFDYSGYDELKPIYMITGFLAKESNTSGNEIKSKARNFPTIELDDYIGYGYEEEGHILLSYTNQTLVDDKWQMTPIPRGMSGGAIIKGYGTCLKCFGRRPKNERQLLSAITIEHHRDKGDKLGFLLGTRVNVFLGLIYQFIPEILDDFLEQYNKNPDGSDLL